MLSKSRPPADQQHPRYWRMDPDTTPGEEPADTEEQDEDDEALGERLRAEYEQEAIEFGGTTVSSVVHYNSGETCSCCAPTA